jgi:hypothetical protein
MQFSMRNQCSGLFTCIMNFLYVLYMTFMVWIYILCVTLMLFIYMYYGLFTCTHLVDIILLFFTFFLFNDWFSGKFDRFLPKFVWKSPNRFIGKSWQFIGEFNGNLVKLA